LSFKTLVFACLLSYSIWSLIFSRDPNPRRLDREATKLTILPPPLPKAMYFESQYLRTLTVNFFNIDILLQRKFKYTHPQIGER